MSFALTQPERIQGGQYSVKSDVWSLGITMVELAQGCFPFAMDSNETVHIDDRTTTGAMRSGHPARTEGQKHQAMSILELLQHIVYEPPPRLSPETHFPPLLVRFIDLCLEKNPAKRPTPMELRNHPYVLHCEVHPVDMAGWVQRLGTSR